MSQTRFDQHRCRLLPQGTFDLKGELPQVPANVRLVKGTTLTTAANAVLLITIKAADSCGSCYVI